MMTLKDEIFVSVLLIALTVVAFILGLKIGNSSPDNYSMISNAGKHTYGCYNLSLEDSAYCLRYELSGFYFYNISNVGKTLTLDELKTEGGVCSHYSEFYKDSFINLGFNAKIISMEGDDVGHVIAVAWTKNISNGTYCTADQLKVECTDLE
jgi:hypothetical protein